MRHATVCFVKMLPEGVVVYSNHENLDLVLTSLNHSNSVILSLAEHMANLFPTLLPPEYQAANSPQQVSVRINLWTNCFVDVVLNQNALRCGQGLFLKIVINGEYSNMLLERGFTSIQAPSFLWSHCHSSLDEVCLLRENAKQRTICFCFCYEVEEKPVKKSVNLIALHQGLFFNNEKWKYFKVCNGEIPTPEELGKADVIIVPGGDHSIRDYIPSIQEFKCNLLVALNANPEIKYLGICFGMQLLCCTLGARIEKAKTFTSKVERVILDIPKIYKTPFHQQWKQDPCFTTTAYHGDQVVELPDQLEVLGFSKSCRVEIVLSKNRRYLGFQGHPDYSAQFVHHFDFEHPSEQIQFVVKEEHNFEQSRRVIANFLGSSE